MTFKMYIPGIRLCSLAASASILIACSQQKNPSSTDVDTPLQESEEAPATLETPDTSEATETADPQSTLTEVPVHTTNRLSRETSPYLLQHADNPVDWYPWGTEAFEKARTENKPIFLSVGYSTCHWCHVMERESFKNPEIAKMLNDNFVSIKVDREERPDVDKLYMSFVQSTTGRGGWPMNVWLTPDLRPFAGGSYFPRQDRHGLPGLATLLSKIQTIWKTQRERILAQSEQNTLALRRLTSAAMHRAEEPPGDEALGKGYTQIAERFDPEFGGFTDAPKFPRPVTLNFLMRFYAQDDGASAEGRHALEMSLLTLRTMASGGLYDHLGGGFHRYCVDRAWQVPHFEKMLYDQAQLAVAYLDAYHITQNPFYADITRSVLNYVQHVLRDESGAFYSAEDAESLPTHDASEKAEGAFYLWTVAEITETLGEPRAPIFNAYYGIRPDGNAPESLREAFGYRNILAQKSSVEELAVQFNQSEDAISTLLKESRAALFTHREGRPRPHRDDKILTAWNGLMISAFSRAYQTLDNPTYLETAVRAAAFIQEHLYTPETGVLLRSYRKGPSAIHGFLSDYAYLIQGLLDLYEASFDLSFLRWALRLQETQDTLFTDAEHGGYYNATADDPSILLRLKEDYDGPQPSPNSVAALNLLRLSQLTGNKALEDQALTILQAFGGRLDTLPFAMPQMLVALQYSLQKPLHVILAGDRDDPLTKDMLRTIHGSFLPYKVIMLVEDAETWQSLAPSLDVLKSIERRDGTTTAYVCEDFVCQLPTNDPTVLTRLLSKEKREPASE